MILNARFIVSWVSCSPFKICSVMKLDIRELVLLFLFLRADVFVKLMMDNSSLSCSCSGLFRLSGLNVFPFFQFITQFYSSSVKTLYHVCSLLFALGDCLVISRDCCCFCNKTLTVLIRLAISLRAIFKISSFFTV